MQFLTTNDGLVAGHAIVLIEDHPENGGPWPVHYRYGGEIRKTTAEEDHIKEFLSHGN
jgi:hypothetical protein